MVLVVIAAVPLLIWIVLLFGRGGFWRVSKHLPPTDTPDATSRTVAVIIPARNEAESIGLTVTALLRQECATPIHVFVVDDNSSDGTAEIAMTAARVSGKPDQLRVLSGRPLATGWTGKLWAMSQGIEEAATLSPDYFLFTDADITHAPTSVAELVRIAEAGRYDLTSFMAKLACDSTAERMLIPAFVFFFFMLYPPAWVSSPTRKTAAAAGGCVLIKPEALEKIGGIASIRREVIDDCSLARRVKQTGGRLWLGLTDIRHSHRSYGSFAEIGFMISRTAFNQLQHSILLLIFTLFGLLLTYFLPIALLFSGKWIPALLGLTTWLIMTACYLPIVRFYGRSPLWSLLLPAVALFYAGATMHSAIQYWAGKGGQWKGRTQDGHQS